MKKKTKRAAFADLLRSRNINASKLGELLGYKDKSRSTIYKWIYGKGAPNASTMLKLMEILDVSAEEILRIFANE